MSTDNRVRLYKHKKEEKKYILSDTQIFLLTSYNKIRL